MEVRLVLETDGKRVKTVRLTSAETLVGRRQDCDIRIPSAEVSRRHSLISIHDGRVSVEDLDSVNGTFVNGKRTVGKHTVMPGDTIEIGPAIFTVEYELAQHTMDYVDIKKPRRNDQPDDLEVVEDLEPADDDVMTLESVEEHLDVVPLAESEAQPVEDEDDGRIPVSDDLENLTWKPPEGDFRDLLSDMGRTGTSKRRPIKDEE